MNPLIGADLKIPTNTNMNRKQRSTSCKPTKKDPPQEIPDFRPLPFNTKSKKSSRDAPRAEGKRDRVSYSLGQEAKAQDMVTFDGRDDLMEAVGRLKPNDYAFVRRSGGKFCFAIIKSIEPNSENHMIMELFVNSAGATKSIPMSGWENYIRPAGGHVTCNSSLKQDRRGKRVGRRHTVHQEHDEGVKNLRGSLRGYKRWSCPKSMGDEDPPTEDSDSSVDKRGSQKIKSFGISQRRLSSPIPVRPPEVSSSVAEKIKSFGTGQRRLSSPIPVSPEVNSEVAAAEGRISPVINDDSAGQSNGLRELKITTKVDPDDCLDKYVRAPVNNGDNDLDNDIEHIFCDYEPKPEFSNKGCDDEPKHIQPDSDDSKSNIATINKSRFPKSSLRNSQLPLDEDEEEKVDERPRLDEKSKNVSWHLTKSQIQKSYIPPAELNLDLSGTEDNSLENLLQQSMPVLSRPSMRRSQTEYESTKHTRRATADEPVDNKSKPTSFVRSKKRHSRRATVATAGFAENQKFCERGLLSAFAAIHTGQ